jgi:hypothetical protein
MSPSQELSATYGEDTNLIEFQTSFIIELYNQLQDAVHDLEQDLNNLDVSNATEFIYELANIITSDLTEANLKEPYQPAPETIRVNFPFRLAQLLRLNQFAFASLVCDRRLSIQAHNQIGKVCNSIKEVIKLLFSNISQPERIEVVEPMHEAERLGQMISTSTRYGIISLADARNTIRELIDIDAEKEDLVGSYYGEGLNQFITEWMEHIAGYMIDDSRDLNSFVDSNDTGYISISIPCNLHELMSMVTGIFSKLINAMQPTKREMSEIRSLEVSLKQTLTEFHECLVRNEIRAYASIG